jgi:hypothetical protein
LRSHTTHSGHRGGTCKVDDDPQAVFEKIKAAMRADGAVSISQE